VSDGVPEEQRFDFAADDAEDSVAGADVAATDGAGAELRRRIDDVLAAAQRAEQRRGAPFAPGRPARRRA